MEPHRRRPCASRQPRRPPFEFPEQCAHRGSYGSYGRCKRPGLYQGRRCLIKTYKWRLLSAPFFAAKRIKLLFFLGVVTSLFKAHDHDDLIFLLVHPTFFGWSSAEPPPSPLLWRFPLQGGTTLKSFTQLAWPRPHLEVRHGILVEPCRTLKLWVPSAYHP